MPGTDATYSDIPRSLEYAEEVKHRTTVWTAPDGQRVVIRHAQPQDAEEITALDIGACGDEIAFLQDLEELGPDVEESRGFIVRTASEPTALFLVAEVDGAVIGHLGIRARRLRKGRHVASLGVIIGSAWRGRGIGGVLMRTGLEWAAAHPQIEKVKLQVFAVNERAIRLYRRFGFSIEGRLTRDVKLPGGEYTDVLEMFRFV